MTAGRRKERRAPQIPDHEVFGCIGEGSYGQVWLARTVLGTWRAVKVVHRDLFQTAASYDREFSGLRRFEPLSRSHAGFVDILHSGENSARDCFHYVMELADDASAPDVGGPSGGAPVDPDRYRPRTLASELRSRGRLAPAECVRIGCILADALARLHQQQLIHRDIKPSNIVLVGGEPKLADIGLVIEVAEARSFVGTEGYVAPEGPNSPQSDLYSLGMVLYEAAMGMDCRRFPSPGPAMRDGPDSAALRELNAVLTRACATRREERYASAGAMAADLERLRQGGSVQERQRRLRLLWAAGRAAAAMVLVAASLGLGTALWHLWKTRQIDARLARARAHATAGMDSMMSEDLGAAAVQLAESLPDWVQEPREADLQRIRLRQILAHTPRPLVSIPVGSAVSSVAFSPDGQSIATGDAAGTVGLWDSRSGRLLGRFSGLDGAPDVRFSPDGRRLWVLPCAVNRADGRMVAHRAVVLDAVTLRPTGADIADVEIAALSPDGGSLAVVLAGSRDVRLLDAASGAVRHVLRGHGARIGAIAFSADGKRLATGGVGVDKSIRLWDTVKGTAVDRGFPSFDNVKHIAFHPQGDSILVTTAAGQVGLRTIIVRLSGPAHDVVVNQTGDTLSAADTLGAGGRRFALFDEPHGLSIRSFDDGQRVLPALQFPSGQCVRACVGPDGASLVAGSDDGWVRVWDLLSGAPRTHAMQLGTGVYALAFSPDAARLATGTRQGLVRIWDGTPPAEDAEPMALRGLMLTLPHLRFPYPASLVADDTFATITEVGGAAAAQVIDLSSGRTAAMDPPPGILPTGSLVRGQRAHLWASFNLLMSGVPGSDDVVLARRGTEGWRSFRLAHPSTVGDVVFTAGDSQLVSIDREARIRVWRTEDGALVREVALPHPESPERVLMPVMSPDAHFALWTDYPARSRLFYARWNEGSPVVRSLPFKPSIHGYSLHRTAPLAAIRTADHHLHVLDLERGLEIPLPGAQGVPVLANLAKWCPTSRRLLVETDNGSFLLLDFERSIELPIPGPRGGVASASYGFSPDGQWIVAATTDGRVWAADTLSGEPVTPWLSHREAVRFVGITSRDRLVTLDGLGVLRSWELKPSNAPDAELRERARLLAGRGLRNQRLEWLPPDALARMGAPGPSNPAVMAKVPNPDAARWHRAHATQAESIPRWEAARFHARRWAMDLPGPDSSEANARLAALAIPPRDPKCPATAINLDGFYTHSFGMLPRGEYDRLPRGHAVLHGIPFDLRGLIRLEPPDFGALLRAEATAPLGSWALRTLSGIPIGRPCRRIHFLQAPDGRFRGRGEECARWRIRFTDGGEREFPLVFGRHFPEGSRLVVPHDAASASPFIAWSDAGQSSGSPAGAYLCRVTWDNPEPANPIHSLDFTVGSGRSRTMVMAISVE